MSVQRSNMVQPGEPLIELRDVSKRFVMAREHRRSFQESFIRLFRRERTARDIFWPLKQVSLTINHGDCVGVIGANGSGKSTLLKLITGILTPDEGKLRVNGRISSLLELGAGFHPDLTGRENIYLNGSIYGLNRAEMAKRLDKIIDYAELGDFIDTPIKHYSSGMYVRLGFAVAIHTNPDLLLVDEVLAVGDVSFQRKCFDSIEKFRRRGGTLLFVSHDLNTIQTLCDRVVWLEKGVIQTQGAPVDVLMDYHRFFAKRDEAQHQAESDSEEKAAQAVEASKQHWGTGRVRIKQVELWDADGHERTNFYNGESITIRLHYETDEVIEKPIFGLAIYNQHGIHICGPNTKFGGLTIPILTKSGVISYHVPALPFLNGGYQVSVAVVNQSDTETFDYYDRTIQFSVYPGASQETYGILTLNGVWCNDAIEKPEKGEPVPPPSALLAEPS
jgi:ABC-type polysaccharide/polyol phosphate transport system ATPase subunit